MKKFIFTIFIIFLSTGLVYADSTDFEDLSLDGESYWNGEVGSGGFVSGGITFSNNYDDSFGWVSWDGFAYSNITDTTSDGYDAQYNAIPGSGVRGSNIYAVGYVSSFAAAPPTITLTDEQIVSGAYFTNNNYAYFSMRDGDDFAKQFTSDDWFKLTITGIDADGSTTGSVEFKLADGTNIVDRWTWVSLEELGAVKQLTFALASTDNGDYGMNTPAYFCMDNFNQKDSSDDDTCFIDSMAFNIFKHQ